MFIMAVAADLSLLERKDLGCVRVRKSSRKHSFAIAFC
jgi:hypothetical protein